MAMLLRCVSVALWGCSFACAARAALRPYVPCMGSRPARPGLHFACAQVLTRPPKPTSQQQALHVPAGGLPRRCGHGHGRHHPHSKRAQDACDAPQSDRWQRHRRRRAVDRRRACRGRVNTRVFVVGGSVLMQSFVRKHAAWRIKPRTSMMDEALERPGGAGYCGDAVAVLVVVKGDVELVAGRRVGSDAGRGRPQLPR